MIRTQIQLNKGQVESLKNLSRQRGCSLATLIREGVDLLLARSGRPSPEQLRARAAAVSGRFRSRLKDLAKQHDDYLAEDYGN